VQEAIGLHDGDWVLLVEEDHDHPDVEVSPGVMGGFGGFEEAKEFTLVVEE